MLCNFIDKLFDNINEEQAWLFWLNKNTNCSWTDFKLSVLPQNINTLDLISAQNDIQKNLMKGGAWSDGTV